MRLSGSPFLGQVRLAHPRPALGQQRAFWDEKEEIRYRNAATAKRQECRDLAAKMNDAWRAYDAAPGHDEGLYKEYTYANNAYNNCIGEAELLEDISKYGPLSMVPAAWHPPTFPMDHAQTPEPEPEPIPEPVRPDVATVDPRFSNPGATTQEEPLTNPVINQTSMTTCPVGSFIDPVTRKCRGSVATGAAAAAGAAGAITGGGAFTTPTNFLQGRIPVAPLNRGRF